MKQKSKMYSVNFEIRQIFIVWADYIYYLGSTTNQTTSVVVWEGREMKSHCICILLVKDSKHLPGDSFPSIILMKIILNITHICRWNAGGQSHRCELEILNAWKQQVNRKTMWCAWEYYMYHLLSYKFMPVSMQTCRSAGGSSLSLKVQPPPALSAEFMCVFGLFFRFTFLFWYSRAFFVTFGMLPSKTNDIVADLSFTICPLYSISASLWLSGLKQCVYVGGNKLFCVHIWCV